MVEVKRRGRPRKIVPVDDIFTPKFDVDVPDISTEVELLEFEGRLDEAKKAVLSNEKLVNAVINDVPCEIGSTVAAGAKQEPVEPARPLEMDHSELIAYAMAQVEDHLRYCSRYKLKATVAKDRIQATIQELVNCIAQNAISARLKASSPEMAADIDREAHKRATSPLLGSSKGQILANDE